MQSFFGEREKGEQRKGNVVSFLKIHVAVGRLLFRLV